MSDEPETVEKRREPSFAELQAAIATLEVQQKTSQARERRAQAWSTVIPILIPTAAIVVSLFILQGQTISQLRKTDSRVDDAITGMILRLDANNRTLSQLQVTVGERIVELKTELTAEIQASKMRNTDSGFSLSDAILLDPQFDLPTFLQDVRNGKYRKS